MDKFKFPNFTLGLLSFSILIFIFNQSKNTFYQNSINLSQQIIDNNNFSLIYNINIIEKGNECSNPLIFYNFKGFKEGCLINNNYLKRDECNLFNKLFKKTQRIKNIDSMNFINLYGKTFCLTSSKLNLNKYIIRKSCYEEINETDCGYFDIDKNKLCIKKELSCPINNIIFNNYSDVNSIKIKDNLFLQFSNNNKEGNILFSNNLFISEGNLCLNKYEHNTFHIPYILDSIYENYTCKTFIKNLNNFNYFDTRFKLILTIKTNDFFIDNNVNISNIPYYPFLNSNLNLYSGLYIQDKINIKDNVFLLRKCSFNNTFSIFLIRLCLILYFISHLIKIYKRYIPDTTTNIYDFICNILIILLFIFSIISYFLLNKIIKASNKSYDFNIDKEIYYIIEFIKETKNILFNNIIGFIWVIFFQIFIFFYNSYLTRNKNFNQQIKTENETIELITSNSEISLLDNKNILLINE